MRASKTITVVLLALILAMPGVVAAATIPVGFVVFDTFIAGPDGTNAFFISNFTGDPATGGFALPPDFPVVTPLVFNAPLLEWDGPAGSPFDFGLAGIGPGPHDPDAALQFPDTELFVSARVTASLSSNIFQLDDGRFFAASSTAIDATIVNPAGTLSPGDFVLLTVEADEVIPSSEIPEPATLTLVATALAGAWRRRRARPNRRTHPSR